MGFFSVGDQVKIKSQSNYHGRFAGEFGEVVRQYDDNVAVKIDGHTNKAATPGQEKKGKPQEPPAPPKKPDEKGEGGK